jgi:hypothetical protein
MKKYFLYIYLGMALDFFANLSFLNWKFYAILIPVIILETFANHKTN